MYTPSSARTKRMRVRLALVSRHTIHVRSGMCFWRAGRPAGCLLTTAPLFFKFFPTARTTTLAFALGNDFATLFVEDQLTTAVLTLLAALLVAFVIIGLLINDF